MAVRRGAILWSRKATLIKSHFSRHLRKYECEPCRYPDKYIQAKGSAKIIVQGPSMLRVFCERQEDQCA